MSYKSLKELRDIAILQLARKAEATNQNSIDLEEVDEIIEQWENERERFELYCCQFYDWLCEQIKNETISPDSNMTTRFRVWYERKAPWNRRN